MREFYIEKPVTARTGNECLMPVFTGTEVEEIEFLKQAYTYNDRCTTLSIPSSRYGVGFNSSVILSSDQTRALYLPYLINSVRELHTHAPLQVTAFNNDFSIDRILEFSQENSYSSFDTTASILFVIWDRATSDRFQQLDNAFTAAGITRPFHGAEVFMTENTRHFVRIVKHTNSSFSKSNLIIITNKVTTVMMYRLFQTLGALLPEIALKDPEWAALLITRNFDKYMEKLLKEIKPLQDNIRKLERRKTAALLSNKVLVSQRSRYDHNLCEAQANVDSALARYIEYTRDLENIQKEILYFDTEQGPSLERACKALITLLENPAIVDVQQPDTKRLRFSLLVKCTGFDENHARVITDKTEHKAVRRILQALLIEQSAFIYLYAGVDLNIDGSGNYDGRAGFQRNGLPMRGLCNPHLAHYNCWGGNAALMTKALKKVDLYTAVLLAMSCVGSVNLLDGPSVSCFREDIRKGVTKTDANCCYPCVEVPGREKLMTLNEFYRYLQEQDTKLAETEAPTLDPVELQHITPAAPNIL